MRLREVELDPSKAIGVAGVLLGAFLVGSLAAQADVDFTMASLLACSYLIGWAWARVT